MMSSADLGAGVVDMSIPVSDGAPIQFHLHLHADTDQDCTIDLVATDEGIQIRLRGAQPVDDADQQPDNEDKPRSTGNLMRDLLKEVAADMATPEWKAEHEASLAAAAAEEEAASSLQGMPVDPEDDCDVAEEAKKCTRRKPRSLPQDDATHVYLGKPFDWTVAERVTDGVVFTRGERELFRVPEERFEEMRQLFVLEDTGLITVNVDGFRVCREDWAAHIFDGDIFFEAIPASKFALLSRLFT